jgi:hypothetical protein
LDFELLIQTLDLKIILTFTETNLRMKYFIMQKRKWDVLSSTCFVVKLFLVSKIEILTCLHVNKTQVLNVSEKFIDLNSKKTFTEPRGRTDFSALK